MAKATRTWVSGSPLNAKGGGKAGKEDGERTAVSEVGVRGGRVGGLGGGRKGPQRNDKNISQPTFKNNVSHSQT